MSFSASARGRHCGDAASAETTAARALTGRFRPRAGALRAAVLLLIVAGLALWGAGRLGESMVLVSETDARVAADMVTVSSQVAGQVVERPARDGSQVGEGDVLAVLDSRGARARLAELEAELRRREAELVVHDTGHIGTGAPNPERAILEARRDAVLARIRRQELDIAAHIVGSPLTGVVSKVFVEAGEHVEPGQRIALAHDPREVYVQANIRETEIRKLALGQSVRIEVDAYPDRSFEGTVSAIGPAATSTFALLPSAKPGGSFTKVTQRFPVRIALEPDGESLRPGMMVEVFIDITDE